MIKKCTSRPHRWLIGGALAGTLWVTAVQAQPLACSSRGQLGVAYCDADGDLVADTPLQTLNPDRLMIGITATEDAMTAKRTYGDFLNHLASCTKKEVLLFPPTREGDVIEAMRTGRVHIGQFATGATMFAVNHAGAVPFAGKGHAQTLRADGYQLLLIVRADSPFKHPKDLKGKKLAHTTVTSNSGNLAPRAIFPSLGLTPGVDYQVEFSGKHENSVNGVLLGLYDGAAVASDVLQRLINKGSVQRESLRVIYQSEDFPPDAFSMAHNLDPKLAAQIRACFLDYKWPAAMSRALEGNDRFVTVTYQKDWQVVRVIAKAAGTPVGPDAYQKLVSAKKK